MLLKIDLNSKNVVSAAQKNFLPFPNKVFPGLKSQYFLIQGTFR